MHHCQQETPSTWNWPSCPLQHHPSSSAAPPRRRDTCLCHLCWPEAQGEDFASLYLLHLLHASSLCFTRGCSPCANIHPTRLGVPRWLLSPRHHRHGEAGSSQLQPPALPSLAGALGTGERSGTGAEMLPRDSTVPTDQNKAVTNDMCWWPPRSPPAGSVVSDANLLQLITATAAAAAAFTKSRGMPDYFHAPREPRGCVCTGCFPNISQGPACPGAGGCPKY